MIKELVTHFMYSGLAGLLAFSLMRWIIFPVGLRTLSRSGLLVVSQDVSPLMTISCLLVALSFALLAHWAQDAFWIWYISPIDIPLKIIVSNR